MAHLRYNDKLAVAVSRLHATNSINAPHIFCFAINENIYNYPVSMLIRKNHHLFDRINSIVYRSFESGLFTKWINDGTYFGYNRIDDHPYRVQFAIEHIAGAIIAYFTMGSMAIIALITEIIVDKKMRPRNVHQFWRLMNKLIDNRHYGAIEIFNDVRSSPQKKQNKKQRTKKDCKFR